MQLPQARFAGGFFLPLSKNKTPRSHPQPTPYISLFQKQRVSREWTNERSVFLCTNEPSSKVFMYYQYPRSKQMYMMFQILSPSLTTVYRLISKLAMEAPNTEKHLIPRERNWKSLSPLFVCKTSRVYFTNFTTGRCNLDILKGWQKCKVPVSHKTLWRVKKQSRTFSYQLFPLKEVSCDRNTEVPLYQLVRVYSLLLLYTCSMHATVEKDLTLSASQGVQSPTHKPKKHNRNGKKKQSKNSQQHTTTQILLR